MRERDIDVAVVTGAVKGNATMYYMVNGAALSHAIVIKRRGQDPVLLCSSMEREEAAASGLETVDMAKYDYLSILKNAGGDRLKARVELMRKVFEDQGVSGKTAFYGTGGVGSSWVFLNALDEALSDVEVTGEHDDDVFLRARMTKGPEEVARIREAGRLTKEVVQHMIDFVRSHKLEGSTFTKKHGEPLTIGDCKAEIRVALAKRKLIEEVDTIFAIGRDAGIPHSRGNDPDPIETGKTIVFDIFPQEQGGGYFFDMTRTFVFGEASDEILKAYGHLEDCYDAVSSKLEAGEKAATYQDMTCDFFEKLGYETPRKNPQVTNGYVHSLGHGVGLDVHEKPMLSSAAGNEDTLEVGSVFTVEPGLYFPDKGFGMRIEDIYHVTEGGQLENLTNFPRGLVFEV
ncbi:MAG: M24 family metallopeptidase [Candidatus Eisenbacteria bacterium]|nr:M24 family metallopeptidase [Candidatus Eisenbacteria bacterium]